MVHFVQNPADILAMVFDVRDSVIVLGNRVTTLLDAGKFQVWNGTCSPTIIEICIFKF